MVVVEPMPKQQREGGRRVHVEGERQQAAPSRRRRRSRAGCRARGPCRPRRTRYAIRSGIENDQQGIACRMKHVRFHERFSSQRQVRSARTDPRRPVWPMECEPAVVQTSLRSGARPATKCPTRCRVSRSRGFCRVVAPSTTDLSEVGPEDAAPGFARRSLNWLVRTPYHLGLMSKILPKCRGQGPVRDVSTWPIVGKPFAALPTRSYRNPRSGHLEIRYCALWRIPESILRVGGSKIVLQQYRPWHWPAHGVSNQVFGAS